jgi:hypothetical protein
VPDENVGSVDWLGILQILHTRPEAAAAEYLPNENGQNQGSDESHEKMRP